MHTPSDNISLIKSSVITIALITVLVIGIILQTFALRLLRRLVNGQTELIHRYQTFFAIEFSYISLSRYLHSSFLCRPLVYYLFS